MNWDTHLRLRHVRTFIEIARSESVSAAAERMNITQPAVSRSLKELEEMLGRPLFDRVGRGLRLNEAGRIFQSHASASMVELLRGRDRLRRDGGLSQSLAVGVLPTAASELVPNAAMAFRAERPHVRINIMTGPNWLLFNQLRDGKLDLVVGRMPEKDAATGVSFEQLYTEQVVLVCRPGHPILSGDAEEQLAEFTLILPPRGAFIFEAVQRYLTSIGLPGFRGAFETVALPVGRRIVRSTDALWFISRGVVAEELSLGSLIAVDLSSPILSGPVGISVSQSAAISVERSVFVEAVREASAILPQS